VLRNAGTRRSSSANMRKVRARFGVLTAIAATMALAAFVAGVPPAVAAPPSLNVINAGGQLPAPLSTSVCLADFGISCYTPLQYRVAYNLSPLYNSGITGSGKTILIVDSFGSPTIRSDLQTFDSKFGLPNRHLRIVQFGTIPPFDPANSTMVGWAQETTLDVEYAHSIAPGANIVLAETPVAETEGVTGFPEMMKAEKSLIDQGVGDVISQSFGATENTFPGFSQADYSSLLDLRYAYQDALRRRVTVLGAAGDTGATNYELDGMNLYPYRVNSWPSSDPLVTSIGGSQLYLDNDGDPVQPDSVWNDSFGAGGGGLSAVFGRPVFQIGVANVVAGHRGTPDISMSAAVNGGAWVYWSFLPYAGWNIVGGTSEATPMFSGVVAMADQAAGHRLGDINPKLYVLGALGTHSPTGIVDITSGNNSFGGVTGFNATPRYDLASGWGTVDGNKFVRALGRF
jgi:subtilase family serine protease